MTCSYVAIKLIFVHPSEFIKASCNQNVDVLRFCRVLPVLVHNFVISVLLACTHSSLVEHLMCRCTLLCFHGIITPLTSGLVRTLKCFFNMNSVVRRHKDGKGKTFLLFVAPVQVWPYCIRYNDSKASILFC